MYKVGRSRTPQGVRGLKQIDKLSFFKKMNSRTPQGVRGLKLLPCLVFSNILTSHSARSAWIETGPQGRGNQLYSVALRKECVD